MSYAYCHAYAAILRTIGWTSGGANGTAQAAADAPMAAIGFVMPFSTIPGPVY